jgi:hypothetical protein
VDAKLLQSQLLKARESKVSIGRMSFTIRRPTEMQLIRMRRPDSSSIDINLKTIQTHVVGWEGVLESDIVNGGASDPVPFDVDLYSAWIEDRPEVWVPLIEAFGNAIASQDKRFEALRGNSSAPSIG